MNDILRVFADALRRMLLRRWQPVFFSPCAVTKASHASDACPFKALLHPCRWPVNSADLNDVTAWLKELCQLS